jgi:cysteinyl-tRNA synthetase
MDKAKMSKSSGDFLTLQKLEEQGFHPWITVILI